MAEHLPMQGALDFEAAIRNLRAEAARALKAAQQLARINDPLTQEAFEDAERVTDRAADAELQVKVRESFASFLKDQGHLRTAKERLVRAEQIAQENGFDEDVARLQVRIKEVEAEQTNDAGMKAYFANSRAVAENGSYSWQDRRDAMQDFLADRSRSGGRLAARSIGGSIDDCKERLDRARRGRGED